MEGNNIPKEETKMVGGMIKTSIYWAFKKMAAERKESITEALENALLLYINDMKEVKTDVKQ